VEGENGLIPVCGVCREQITHEDEFGHWCENECGREAAMDVCVEVKLYPFYDSPHIDIPVFKFADHKDFMHKLRVHKSREESHSYTSYSCYSMYEPYGMLCYSKQYEDEFEKEYGFGGADPNLIKIHDVYKNDFAKFKHGSFLAGLIEEEALSVLDLPTYEETLEIMGVNGKTS
jgi:hypothetical protein